MKKRAFTIAEFVICIMIIVLVMGATVSIPFKMKKQTKTPKKQANLAKCSCVDSPINNECDIEIDNPTGRYEFFTISMTGAGGAGSPGGGSNAGKGGLAGESKTMVYPMLSGKYLIKLGKGGVFGSSDINGGNTVIYKITNDGKYEILEYALGGAGHKENVHNDELYDDSLALGETLANSSGHGERCGAGGATGENGIDGEVIIKW